MEQVLGRRTSGTFEINEECGKEVSASRLEQVK